MKLEFMYLPTQDLTASLTLYRDTLGFDELWREGDQTVGLAVPGTDIALMIDAAAMPGWGPGPVFMVENVVTFHAQHDGAYALETEPFEFPGGMLSMLRDAGGNPVYVMDQSREAVG